MPAKPARIIRYLFLMFLVAILLPATPHASIAKRLSLAEMVAEATTIAQGTVRNIRYEVINEGAQVFTYVDIEPSVSLKTNKDANHTITIKLFGGMNGNYLTAVVGGPTFEPGEEVLVFLKEGRGIYFENHLRTLGLAQGKFRLHTDPSSGRKLATRDLDDLHLKGNRPPDLLDQATVGLEGLLQEIRKNK